MRGDIVFVLGVAGSGKSTVAMAIADQIGAVFLEGDEFHPEENVEAMRAGIPLNDDMRWGWLRNLASAAAENAEHGKTVLVACSGLKRAYRDLLRAVAGPSRMVLLTGDKTLIHDRMQLRRDHYMPPTLLDSQFADLELPEASEPDIAIIDVSGTPDAIIAAAFAAVFPDP